MRTTDLVSALAAVLAAEREALADLIVQKLRASNAEIYTSQSLPPGLSRARFVRVAPTIAGARREGRTWIVSRDAWEAARTKRRGEAAAAPAAEKRDDVDDMLADAGLRATKLRLVGGGSR